MEDYQAQEQEFWAKLEEEELSRGALLRRSAAAAVGLTILSSPATAFARSAAARSAAVDAEAMTSAGITMKELIRRAKKEGHVNLIALPRDWANYGEVLDAFKKKYGIAYDDANPNGSSSQENQAIRSLKGDSRAPDAVDVSPTFAVSGASEGLYAKYKVKTFKTVPRGMKDGRGYWTGDYYGVISIGYNANLVSRAPRSFGDLLRPEYKNKVALNGSPLTSGSAIAGVFAAALANGGSLSNISPGVDWFAKLKKAGNWLPIGGTPQTVASGQTPIVIDWDYLNIAYRKEFPPANWKTVIPSDGVYGAYYCQAINASAPHPWAARLWEEFLYSDQGQLLFLKGYSHPARFANLAKRHKIPARLLKALPAPKAYAKVRFASPGQQTKAKTVIGSEWPSKMGS